MLVKEENLKAFAGHPEFWPSMQNCDPFFGFDILPSANQALLFKINK